MAVRDGGPSSGAAFRRVPGPDLVAGLQAGEVHVWLAPSDLDARQAAAGWAWLDDPERERALGTRAGTTRGRFIGARTRVRQIVAGILDRPPESVGFAPRACPCGEVDRGRPGLVVGRGLSGGGLSGGGSSGGPAEASLLEVSISHARSLVAVALAWASPVGVDIEEAAERRPVDGVRIARRFFTAGEQELVAADPDEFARLWARKEAVGKAVGTGLAHGGLTRDVRAGRVPTGFGQPELVVGVIDLLVAGGYRAAVAGSAAGPARLFELAGGGAAR